MRTYDVVVIGGGPAGAMAGYQLARQGHDVLLLEKALFPRPKPCGGALSPKAYGQLDFDISDLVKARVRRTLVRGPGRSALVLEFGETEVWMVYRPDLDRRLLERASQAGALVHQGEGVLNLRPDGQGVVTTRGEYGARVLVGADGSSSLVARSLGLERPRRRMRALCAEYPLAGQPWSQALLDFALPGGYAWLFPKGDLVNVGVCTREGRGSLRPRLESFVHQEGLCPAGAPIYRSWPIPLGGSFRPLHKGNALLVGDAAGLADPLLGEGVAYALMSAQLAALAIDGFLKGNSQDLAAYSTSMRRTLLRDLRALGLGVTLFYRFPRFFLALLGSSRRFRDLATDILSGRRSPSGLWSFKEGVPDGRNPRYFQTPQDPSLL